MNWLKDNWPLCMAWVALALGLLFATHQAKGETLCATATEHNQVPIFEHNGVEWLDCESAQWLTGMNPHAHLGPVSNGQIPPPTCVGGDGFTREENADTWIHDHGGVVDLPGAVPDPTYFSQCPHVANPNWNKYGRKTHTYQTNDGRVFQGRNGSWCVEEPELGNECNPDTISGVITHQQHRGPMLCQIKTPTYGGSVTVHSGCNSAGCVGEFGLQRVRAYDVFGAVTLLGEFPAGPPVFNTMNWQGHRPYIYLDGKGDTPWVALSQLCVEVGCAPSPDFDGDGAVMVADFINGFLPLYETGECSTSDFVTWFLPAFNSQS